MREERVMPVAEAVKGYLVGFLLYRQRVSPRQIWGQREGMRQFLWFMAMHRKKALGCLMVHDITSSDIRAYVRYLQSIFRFHECMRVERLLALRSFVQYLDGPLESDLKECVNF